MDKVVELTKVFPAHAGVILDIATPKTVVTRVPRACGGDPHLVGVMESLT